MTYKTPWPSVECRLTKKLPERIDNRHTTLDNPIMFGRIDVRSHILPGIGDGCATVDESLACARVLVANGYTHSFCTPHVMPGGWGYITRDAIPGWVNALQTEMDRAGIPLKLMPGGEMNFRPDFLEWPDERIIFYQMAGRYALADMWANELPDHFEPFVRWLQERGMTVILAHPERMRAVQDDPSLADYFADIGLLLQGNLQCFNDPSHSDTRRVSRPKIWRDHYSAILLNRYGRCFVI
jgi:protein-tyrosine phosphatase